MPDPIPVTALPDIEDFAARHWDYMWVEVQNSHNRDQVDMVPVHHSWYDDDRKIIPPTPAGIDLLVRWAWWRLTGEVPLLAPDTAPMYRALREAGCPIHDGDCRWDPHFFLGLMLRIAQAVTGSLPEPGTVPRLEHPGGGLWILYLRNSPEEKWSPDGVWLADDIPALAGVTDPVKAARIIVREVV